MYNLDIINNYGYTDFELTVLILKKSLFLSIHRRMDKKKYDTHSYNGILAIKRNGVQIHATTWMNLENMMLTERIQIQKATILHDSINVKYPK